MALLSFLAIPHPGFGQLDPYGPYGPIDPILGPMVRIVSPANHAVFFSPVDIPIFAHVVDSPRATNVEFYAGTKDLGAGFSLGATTPPPGIVFPDFVLDGPLKYRLVSDYCLVWTNAPAGSYALTAVAKGANGPLPGNFLSRTSLPVNITILSPTVPTSGTNVVSIVATDPVAIVGTNSWVWSGMTNVLPAWTNWPPKIWQSFTNWGPKSALFTVRRFGDATAANTVTYAIGGTASNGVDYVQLPGTVTIPAGRAYALIPIVPIDNGPPYSPKTVVLTITPSTNTPPACLVGFPRRATAIIRHDWPRPLPLMLADGSFHLNAAGPDGAFFSVQTSSDLLNWSSSGTNQILQGSIDFVDADAASNTVHFYRAVPQAGPPSQ
jgi:hypothetical protein